MGGGRCGVRGLTAQHDSLTPEFFSVLVKSLRLSYPWLHFVGGVICYSENQASRDSQEYWEIAIWRYAAGVTDFNADKDQASEGNE